MKLVRIIKNWDEPDLLRQTPKSEGVWGNVRFTLDDVDECDYLLILNFVPEKTLVKVDPRNVWALIQEPYEADRFPWVERGHEKFGQVFTHHIFRNDMERYVATQTCLPWYVNKTYDELVELDIPKKTGTISWVSSQKTFLPGHIDRMDFHDQLSADAKFDIDFFGRGINEIKDKYQALAPYKYSIAIENSRSEHYWTEKIADCFLSYTIPIYYGCTNLSSYFPEKSFVQIDINNYQESSQVIAKILEEDIWEDRLDALNEARELVLNKYQLFPFISDLIEKRNDRPVEKRQVSLG
ncbi:glycosyltransferase family 10 domain-containing protein [Pseudomonadota bacterium]